MTQIAPQTDTPITLDLHAARALAEEAIGLLNALEDSITETDQLQNTVKSEARTTKANQARDLLRAKEYLSAASGQVALAYWQFKGHDDPRDAD